MNTTNLTTLKIHKLSKAQYDRELAAGTLEPNSLYLTPEVPEIPGDATEGQFLRFINGKAAWDTITDAEGVKFPVQ